MADDKTRVIPRVGPGKDPPAQRAAEPVEPRVVDGQMVFFCPAGHRLVVPVSLAGKRGKCSKCGVALQIPEIEAPAATVPPEPPEAEPPVDPAAGSAASSATDEGDWNFISGIGAPAQGAPAFDAVPWSGAGDGGAGPAAADANPMARLLARLWGERDHGGIVELHLVGGAVLLPEEFSPRWSGGTHGLFASQAADGSVTLTAVAWDTVQRIVVRQLAAVPDDLFD
jgi:hypothetical protein